MCGIAGVMFKDRTDAPVGKYLYRMLKSLQHRGMDSAGVITYHTPSHWRVRVIAPEDAEEYAKKIRYWLNVHDTKILRLNDGNYLIDMIIDKTHHLDEILSVIKKKMSLQLLSLGRQSLISKDVGLVDDVDKVFKFSELRGSHGIGHVRFSTESGVDALHAHPFQNPEFPDIAIVHNGQITNYWKMRELLELEGHEFQTDNDSELIIHYIVNKIKKGYSLEDALNMAVKDLDGPFAFLISMPEGIGMARDRLGLRPLVVAEGDGILVAGSEEVALREVLPESKIYYMKPGEVRVWMKQ